MPEVFSRGGEKVLITQGGVPGEVAREGEERTAINQSPNGKRLVPE